MKQPGPTRTRWFRLPFDIAMRPPLDQRGRQGNEAEPCERREDGSAIRAAGRERSCRRMKGQPPRKMRRADDAPTMKKVA